MSTVVTCQCGARLRLPENVENRSFRCPKCKTGIALSADVRVLSTYQIAPGQPEATCPICQSPLAGTDEVVRCPHCDQVHHRECWAEIGGCGTYGCVQAPRVANEGDDGGSSVLSAWGDTKSCPLCGETIKAIALKCRYCGAAFDTVDPLTPADLRQRAEQRSTDRTLRQQIVVIFAISFLGCLAPITLIVGLAFLLPKRRQIAKIGPIYQVMAYSSMLLSTVYLILLVMFLLMESSA